MNSSSDKKMSNKQVVLKPPTKCQVLYKKYDEAIKNLKSSTEQCHKLHNQLSKTDLMFHMFQNEADKVESWYDLATKDYYNKKIERVFSRRFTDIIFEYNLSYQKMMCARQQFRESKKEYKEEYKEEYQEECEYVNTKYDHFAKTKKPSTGEAYVMRILNKLAEKRKLCYFYNYRGFPCRNIYPLEYDFFCILIYDERLVVFNIEYDGDQHYHESSIFDNFCLNHKNDILKQYYLTQLNIHLLRLNAQSNIVDDILNFIEIIIYAERYVIMNGLLPIKTLFTDKSAHKGLQIFHDYHASSRLKTAFLASQCRHNRLYNRRLAGDDDYITKPSRLINKHKSDIVYRPTIMPHDPSESSVKRNPVKGDTAQSKSSVKKKPGKGDTVPNNSVESSELSESWESLDLSELLESCKSSESSIKEKPVKGDTVPNKSSTKGKPEKGDTATSKSSMKGKSGKGDTAPNKSSESSELFESWESLDLSELLESCKSSESAELLPKKRQRTKYNIVVVL
jgi:hypothetical protein